MKYFILFIASLSLSAMDKVDPWFTGPLLAPNGHTIPAGHINFEPSLFVTDQVGTYNHSVQRRSAPRTHSVNPLVDFTIGIMSFMDFQAIFQVLHNRKGGAHATRLGDTALILVLQISDDDPSSGWWPDLRFIVAESFPSGMYQKLNPNKNDTDSSGSGSYQTSPGLIIQKTYHIRNYNFLRTRLFFSYTVPSKVHVKSFNTYGGGYGSVASIKPGGKFTSIFAFEYSLTRHLTFATDFEFLLVQKAHYGGSLGTGTNGLPGSYDSSPHYMQFSIAPALEWNFNKNIGLIAGAWMSVVGPSSLNFISGVIALNIYR